MAQLIFAVFLAATPILCAHEITDIRGFANSTPIAIYKRDPCLDPNKQKLRDAKLVIDTISEAAVTYGTVQMSAGSAVGGLFGGGLGTLLGLGGAAHGSMFLYFGKALGMINKFIDVDSKELEYLKCIKRDFDIFKANVSWAFNKVFDGLNELKTQQTKEFGVIKAEMEKNQKVLVDQLKELKDMTRDLLDIANESQAMIKGFVDIFITTEYNQDISDLAPLQKAFDRFFEFGLDIPKMDQTCTKLDAESIFYKLMTVHLQNVLHTKNYGILKNQCVSITADLIRAGALAVQCFAISPDGKHEEAMTNFANEITDHMKNISKKMTDLLEQAKNKTITEELPSKFMRMTSKSGFTCQIGVEALYSYARSVHPWADWAIAEVDFIDVTGINVKKTEIAGCELSFMACEHDNDAKRKQNAKKFREWSKDLIECEWFKKYVKKDKEWSKEGIDTAVLLNFIDNLTISNGTKPWKAIMSSQNAARARTNPFRFSKFDPNAEYIVYLDTNPCDETKGAPLEEGPWATLPFFPHQYRFMVCF